MKKALKIIGNVLVWILLIFALLITIVVFSSDRNGGVANLFGFMPMTVETGSMEPTFYEDDLIIVKEVDDIYSLKEGDVITFWTIIDGQRVKNTHRIVKVNELENTRTFVTRGDNNTADDTDTAKAGDIIGKWTETRIPGFGKVMRFLQTRTGFFICIILPMAIFFLYELYRFIATLIEIRKPRLTETDEEEIKRRAIEEYLASQKAKEGEQPAAEAPKAEEAPAAEADPVTEAPAPEATAAPAENTDAGEGKTE